LLAHHCLPRNCRQGLTTAIADFECFSIEITKNYRLIEWREDLKMLLLKAGKDGKKTVFLFDDTQIVIRIKATLTHKLRKDAIDRVLAAAAEGVMDAQYHLGLLIEESHVHAKPNGKPNLELAAEQYASARLAS
jgi:TPR repeat protein